MKITELLLLKVYPFNSKNWYSQHTIFTSGAIKAFWTNASEAIYTILTYAAILTRVLLTVIYV